MFLNLIKGWYFLIDGKVIWNILQFTNKFWKVTTKFFRSNWINKTCWTEVFFKIIKDFLRGHFPGVGFKVDSCFLAWEKSLSSSLLIADWLILVASGLKYSFFLNVAHSLILFWVFDSSLGLAFWAICWSFKLHSSSSHW